VSTYPKPRLRFHEETLRTPEQAREDEMKALLSDPAYGVGSVLKDKGLAPEKWVPSPTIDQGKVNLEAILSIVGCKIVEASVECDSGIDLKLSDGRTLSLFGWDGGLEAKIKGGKHD